MSEVPSSASSQKWFFGLGIAAGLCATGFGWWHWSHTATSGEIDLASKSSKRPLELTTATNTTSKVDDEVMVALNDPALAQEWGIHKVSAQQAWALGRGSKSIVVAVIDTGCDVNHEDLTANLWNNPGESGLDAKGHDKAHNQIDDDGNGFIDDVHGWNFVSSNADLTDNHGHGTHIAGIIGAEAGNGKGIAGIAPDVSLMCLKYFDPKVPSTDNLKNTVAAIHYARLMKANIINYSGGGVEFSQDEHDAIEDARKAGILFVAAAGNERSNSDVHHYYPADYGLTNIISVTAVDPNLQVLPSSNYGSATVDIAAPGQNILSTLPGNAYGYMTGTSQATAFVTGAAVLVMAHRGIRDPELVKKYIIATGDAESQLVNKTASYRRLNLYKALLKEDEGVSHNGGKAYAHENFNPDGVDADSKSKSLGISAGFASKIQDALEHQQQKVQLRSAGDSANH
jgi:subtilisin family serine protease